MSDIMPAAAWGRDPRSRLVTEGSIEREGRVDSRSCTRFDGRTIRPAGFRKSMRLARNSHEQMPRMPANIEVEAGGAVEIKYTTPPEPIDTTVKREGF